MVGIREKGLDGVRLFGMRVLVEKVQVRNKAGIVLPDSAQSSGETANVCRIVAVGDGRFVGQDGSWKEVALRLKVGDLVVTDPRFAVPLRLEGKVLGIFEEEHVILVIDREMDVL